MTPPNSAGLFIYAVDAPRLAAFYAAVIGLSTVHAADDIIVLRGAELELLIHPIPAQYAAEITITVPPQRREDSALKFFFTVASLEAARAAAAARGGEVFRENWRGPGFVVCNAVDPEGNIFQLRERVSADVA